MRIIIDAMGGDNAPGSTVGGALAALDVFDDTKIFLVGDQQKILKELSNSEYDVSRLTVVPTTEVIEMEDKPVEAIKRKKDSSMVVGLNLLSSGAGDVFISAGSTGALVAGGMFIVNRIHGVKRPALAPVLPTLGENGVLLIDCGANVDCKAGYLAQFALMGSAYMSSVMGIANPRIALLSNGTEDEKGNALTKETHQLLRTMPINFVGNCEARDVLSGKYDVCVCDGFSGNVFLKSVEGTASLIFKMLKKEISSKITSQIGAALMKPAFAAIRKDIDYTEQGGALLLGVKGGIIKTHGSSDADMILRTISQARDFVLGDVVGSIKRSIASCVFED